MDLNMAEISGLMQNNEEEWHRSPKYHQRMEVTQEEEETKHKNQISTGYEGGGTSEQSKEVEKCENAQGSEGDESEGSSEESEGEDNDISVEESNEEHEMDIDEGNSRSDKVWDEHTNHVNMCELSKGKLDEGW